MKKLISVIPIAILMVILLSTTKVKADGLNNIMAYNNVVFVSYYLPNSVYSGGVTYDPGYYNFYCCSNNQTIYIGDHGYVYNNNYYFCVWGNDAPYQSVTFVGESYPVAYDPNLSSGTNRIVVRIKGDVNNSVYDDYYDSYQDYENSLITPTPTPTPELSMWDKFYEWYYNIYGYYPANDSLFGYFRSLFEDDEVSSGSGGPSQHSMSTHRPAPTPTPTPIPYSISIVPVYDNNGNVTNYIYNYTYSSESGDTIVATSPPDQTNYYTPESEPYNPDPLTVPTSALDAWYMFAYDENEHPNPELQNPNDDFGTGMKYIEDNIDDYDRPIDYIMSVINSFPDEWLMLFGIGIGLIFIAGIISRFLS